MNSSFRMPELGFQEQRSAYRARDSSPDSVIFTLESNFSLFSSTSASVDRCSFASDAHDHDSLASEISLVSGNIHTDHSALSLRSVSRSYKAIPLYSMWPGWVLAGFEARYIFQLLIWFCCTFYFG